MAWPGEASSEIVPGGELETERRAERAPAPPSPGLAFSHELATLGLLLVSASNLLSTEKSLPQRE